MLPTEDLFVYVHVLVDDAISWGPRASRAGQARVGLQRRRAADYRAGAALAGPPW